MGLSSSRICAPCGTCGGEGRCCGRPFSGLGNNELFTGAGIDGRGMKLWEEKYEGQESNGLHHGKGTQQFRTGEKYTGEWEAGKIKGHGRMVWQNDGDHYEGEWEDNLRNGEGTFTTYTRTTYHSRRKETVYTGSW